jgi:hypothetical protein
MPCPALIARRSAIRVGRIAPPAYPRRYHSAYARPRKNATQSNAARSPLVSDGTPAVLATYRRLVLDLEQSMRTDVQEARAALADIFGQIRAKRLTDGM